MLRTTLTTIGCCLLLTASVTAAPLNTKDVAKDAKWLAHVDLASLADSKLAKEASNEWPKKEKKLRAWMEKSYGITPKEDLESLTLYSCEYEKETGVAILKADFERSKVESTLSSKDNVEKSEWNNHTFYTYDVNEHEKADHTKAKNSHELTKSDYKKEMKHKTKQVTTVIADDQTIVCGKTPDQVKQALKVMDEKEPSLASQGESPLVGTDAQTALVYAVATDLAKLPQCEGFLEVLRQHQCIEYTLKEQDDKLVEEYVLKAVDEKVAGKMKEAVQGLIALGEVWTTDAPKLQKMMDEATVEQRGMNIHVRWEGTPDQAVTTMEQVAQHWNDTNKKK
jgi:hypothetical protein